MPIHYFLSLRKAKDFLDASDIRTISFLEGKYKEMYYMSEQEQACIIVKCTMNESEFIQKIGCFTITRVKDDLCTTILNMDGESFILGNSSMPWLINFYHRLEDIYKQPVPSLCYEPCYDSSL